MSRRFVARARDPIRDVALGGARVLARGNRVRCTCCRRSYARFLPRGRVPDLLCPGCRSLERHRVLALYLERETPVFRRRTRVLHIAPEPALYARLRAEPLVEHLTGDLEAGPLVDQLLDARDLPFADESFDVVIAVHVLEHIVEDVAVVAEFGRVLVPGGMALLQFPVDPRREVTLEDPAVVDPAERLRLFGQADHVRVYGADACDRLGRSGYEVEFIPYLDQCTEEQRRRHALIDRGPMRSSDIYRVTKAPS